MPNPDCQKLKGDFQKLTALKAEFDEEVLSADKASLALARGLEATVEKNVKKLEFMTATDFKPLIELAFLHWYGNEAVQESKVGLPVVADPRSLNYEKLVDDVDSSKFGEYTINLEMIEIDWNTISSERIEVIEIPEGENIPIARVMDVVVKKYGQTHLFPGIELWQWMVENYSKVSDEDRKKFRKLMEYNPKYLLPGSLIRMREGTWAFPTPQRRFGDPGWGYAAHWLKSFWTYELRMVLIKK